MGSTQNILRLAAPAIFTCVVSLGLWAILRTQGPLSPERFFGWLALTLIMATVAAVAGGTMILTSLRQYLARYALLAGSAIGMVVGVSNATGLAGLGEAMSAAAVLAGWLALWSAAAWAFRGIAIGMRLTACVTLAMLLIASPVIAMPLIHAAAGWGAEAGMSPWQGRLIDVVRHSSPILALVDAVRPAIRIEWQTVPAMYAWSGFGQDVPAALPNAWTSSGIYFAVAIVLVIAGQAFRARAARRQPPA